MPRVRLHSLLLAAAIVAFAPPGVAPPAFAQSVLERSPNLDGAWTGTPGSAYLTGAHRFTDTGGDADLTAASSFDLAYAPLRSVLAGVRFAPAFSVGDEGDQWEPYARWTPLHEGSSPLEAGATLAWNTASASLDGTLALARWLGPLRLLAEGRLLGDPFDDGVELAAGGGAVLHVLPGRVPVALAGDWTTLVDAPDDVDAAWSVALQVGIPFTQHTLSLHASNAATSTTAGRTFGSDETFYGFELSIPLGIGGLFGMYAPRQAASRVGGGEHGEHGEHEHGAPAAAHARVRIVRYAFMPQVIEIRAGEVVEWINDDAMMHTVNGEDHSWHSGPIESGAVWSARFDEPGRYPYFCGPHPFMKGMVIVR